MRVQVRMGAYLTVYGTLAEVNDDFLRLIDSRSVEEFDESQWFTRIAESDPDMVRSQADGETLIRLYSVASITCISDELPFFPVGRSSSEELKTDQERTKMFEAEIAEFVESHANPSASSPSLNVDEHEQPLQENYDEICIEVGTHLLRFLRHKEGQLSLLARTNKLRQEIYNRIGIIIPKIRIKNSMTLPDDVYRILFWNCEVGRFSWRLDHRLVIPTVEVLEAEFPDREPAFGLPARWVHEEALTEFDKSYDRDFETVLATHLNELIEQTPADFLSLDGVSMLVDRVQEGHPVLINETIPEPVSISLLHGVLIRMLREHIPIVAMPRIIEVVGRLAQSSRDPNAIYTQLRTPLGTIICDRYVKGERALKVFQVEPKTELILRDAMVQGKMVLELSEWVTRLYNAAARSGPVPVLISDLGIREYLWRSLGANGTYFGVLAANELPRNFRTEIIDILKIESDG